MFNSSYGHYYFRFLNIPIVIMYTVIGAIIYLALTIRSKTLNNVFGEKTINAITAKFKKKKRTN